MTKKAAPETAAATAAAESRKEALLDAAARDSPVLTLIAKRLRAAKKKAKRAEEIESIKASGREINADQEEVLKARARNLAAIEELEKLFPLLKEAVAEELSQKISAKAQEIEETVSAAAAEKAAEEAKATAEAYEVERATATALADELKGKIEEATRKAAFEGVRRAEDKAAEDAEVAELQAAEQTSVGESIMRLVQLFYFSKLFSNDGRAENDYIHQMERDACLTYKSTVSFAGESLNSQDLDAICLFGKLVSTRPSTEMVSHETALERCKALALDWVNAAETSIPQLDTTVNELVVKFERIVGSTYYSVKPEMRAPEVTNTATPFRAEASVPAPPGKDTNATSYAVSGGYPPAPAASQTSHNSALHQLLYSRPPQGSAEGHGSLESLPNGFVPTSGAAFHPSLDAGFLPPASSGFLPSAAGPGFVPNAAGPSVQPPGFEPMTAQKTTLAPESVTTNYFAGGFQGPTFGGITSAELAAPTSLSATSSGNGPVGQFLSSSPTSSLPAAPAVPAETASMPAKQQLDDVDALIDRIPERKGSVGTNAHPRPRAAPIDYSRGRGSGRARGGPSRGDHVPRGGRRGWAPPGRSYRGGGRGRDFQQQFHQQPVSGEMY